MATVKNNEYRPDPERQTVDKVCSPTWCLHLEVRPKRLSVLFRQLSRSTEDTESTGIPTFCQPMWAFEYLTPKALPLASNWNWVALTLPEPHLCTGEVHVTRESNLNGYVDLHQYVALFSGWKVTFRHWHVSLFDTVNSLATIQIQQYNLCISLTTAIILSQPSDKMVLVYVCQNCHSAREWESSSIRWLVYRIMTEF